MVIKEKQKEEITINEYRLHGLEWREISEEEYKWIRKVEGIRKRCRVKKITIIKRKPEPLIICNSEKR